MSNAEKKFKFSLKVTVNKKKDKVLFAEVDSAFADLLLSFLTLPLGTIAKMFKPSPFGSLSSLYTGLENLDGVHFWKEGSKLILLHPRSSSDAECKKLKVQYRDPPPLQYFVCSKKCRTYARFPSLSEYYDIGCCDYCKGTLKREVAKNETQTVPCDNGVFVKTTSSFVITDDLHILPNAGFLQIASFLDVTDMDDAETMNVTFGLNEVLKLLECSFSCINPLSTVILNASLEYIEETKFTANASNSNSQKMNLKLMVQKSTNKLLYAEAYEDFVEFLFTFLIIPLGGVESLLSRNSHVKIIDTLYKSAADLIPDKYFINLNAKNRLLKPNIPHGYVSENHIFALTEDKLYASDGDYIYRVASTNFPKGQGSYLIGPRTFKVTDDLTVTPFCFVSFLSSLSEKKIPLSDVKEVELQIGLKEGLSILKASLTSKCALTDALLSQTMTKNPKTEQV